MDSELKNYLDSRFETFDRKLADVAMKGDLAQQTEILKHYADEQTEKLAVIINKTIVEPMDRHFSELKDFKAVREEVTTVRTEMRKIKTALHLS